MTRAKEEVRWCKYIVALANSVGRGKQPIGLFGLEEYLHATMFQKSSSEKNLKSR